MRMVMLVYSYWPGPEGGAERQCRKISHALVKRGVEVTVVTGQLESRRTVKYMDGDVRVIAVPLFKGFMGRSGTSVAAPSQEQVGAYPKRPNIIARSAAAVVRGLNILMYIYGTKKYMKTCVCDLIHVHSTMWIAGVAASLGVRYKVPVLSKETTMPAFPRTPPLVPFRRRWERLRMKNWFLAQHSAAAKSLSDSGVSSDRIKILPNGVEMPDIGKRHPSLGYVLFVGNLTQGLADKGLDTLVRAWGIIVRQCAEVRLKIVGDGDTSAIRAWAVQENCADRIDFLGYVNDIQSQYESAEMLILPSRREGMSNVLLEAMSWGIPIVATDIPGNSAVLGGTEAGMLVPAGDSDALANAITKLYESPEKRKMMGLAARAVIEKRFSIDRVSSRLMDIYSSIIDDNKEMTER